MARTLRANKSGGRVSRGTVPTVVLLTPCYDEPKRTMGSAPKIAEALAKHFRVVVVAGGSSTRTEHRSERLTVRFLKEFLIPDPVNNGPIPFFCLRFNRILREEDPVAVVNLKHMFLPNLGVFVAKLRKTPVITVTDTFPGVNWDAASWYVNVVLKLYARTLGIAVLKASDRVVLFHSALKPIARRLGVKDALVIPNGVDVARLDAAPKAKLPGGSKAFRVAYIGRLESVKGYETIFAAFQQATAKNKNIHCFHVGYDENRQEFKEHYRSPNIHFFGRKDLDGTYSVLKGCDAVILGSRSEGLPNALMEGMAARCVPISTPVGAVPELLDNGKNGILFSYGDTAQLADVLLYLAREPSRRVRLGTRSRKRIEETYDWAVLADRYRAIIDGVSRRRLVVR